MLASAGGLIAAGTAGCLGNALEDDDGEGDPYTVEVAPAGEVEFDAVPERWFPYTGDYADMGVALGQADGLQAIGIRDRFQVSYYEQLPGVDVDLDALTQLWNDGTDPELFYELDADVHLIDPNFMVERIQWDRSDVDEIDRQVGPFVGNTVFSGSYAWHDYEHYTLYEAFEKVAEVFQQRERYEALTTVHDEVTATLEERLPDERPDVAVLTPASAEPREFYPYRIDRGTSFRQYRELEVGDALAEAGIQDFHQSRATIDLEPLVDADPEVIAIRSNDPTDRESFEDGLVSYLEDHPVASELSAVQTGRVVRGGAPYQGPLLYLFQLERFAADLFPEAVTEGELFDRDRVAGIVTDGA